jgi:hypothetical protein
MRNFDEFKTNANSIKIRHGIKIFNKQLQSPEGHDITIDGVACRGIIYNHLNDLSDNEFRGLNVPLGTEIKNGSYVVYNNEYYLNTNMKADNHYFYLGCKITLCNQRLKWKGLPDEWIEGYPCVISNDSYGSKQNRASDYISEIDTKMKILVQANEFTRQIVRDMRFVFNNSEFDIFRVTDITTSTDPGVITIIAAKDTFRIEDDLDNNLAFNEPRIYTPPEEVKEYAIEGEESIRLNRRYTYTLLPEENLTFAVDDNEVAEIAETLNNTCTVLVKAKDEIFKLTASKDGQVVASKVIYTTK